MPDNERRTLPVAGNRIATELLAYLQYSQDSGRDVPLTAEGQRVLGQPTIIQQSFETY